MVFLVMVFGTLGRECQHTVSVGTRLTLPRTEPVGSGVRVLAAAEGSSVPVAAAAERLRAGGNRSRFRAGWCGGVKTRVRVAGNTDLQAERDFWHPAD